MSTADSPRANSARVYEYILSGETPGVPFTAADIAMAQQIAQYATNTLQGMQINHLYIEVAARAYRAASIHHHIDIGAGLPTVGALHEFVEDHDPILYVDHDPEAVAYGQRVLAERPHLRYIEARLEEIEPILEDAERLFGGNRLVGVNVISVAHFVDDDQLSRSLRTLHDWAAPGSLITVTSTQGEKNQDFQQTKAEYSKRTGLSIYLRTPEEMTELFRPWQPFVPLGPIEDQVEAMLGTRVALDAHRGALGYGGLFVKR